MEDRTNCKWMEFFENYDEKERYLCHLTVDSKYVNINEVCANCPHYEKAEETIEPNEEVANKTEN